MMHRSVVYRLAPLAVIVAAAYATAADAQTSVWRQPSIDLWSYVNGGSPGSRPMASSFSNFVVDEQTQQFEPGNGTDPARLASLLVAFETSAGADEGGAVPAGLDPGRYRVNSVTLTARVQTGSSGTIFYEPRPLTELDLLGDALAGGVPSQLPVELFGVGFNTGIDGFQLGADPPADGSFLDESNSVYIGPGGTYGAFPAIGDGDGGLVDVANNLTGGFSVTAAGGVTEPFAATPWAVGAAAGLSAGDAIPADTTFTFEVDLTQPGVVSYLQESLSAGVLSFYLSTVHAAGQFGVGGAGFPQWYTKEGVALFEQFGVAGFAGAEAASLSVDVTIVEESVTGDYNRDGQVDIDDYLLWRSTFGSQVAAPGDGADGNADGVVGVADYTVWRDLLPAPSGVIAAAAPVPDPSGATLAIAALGAFLARRRPSALPPRSDEGKHEK